MSARLLLTLLAVAAISLGVMAADQIVQGDVSGCGPTLSGSGNYTDGSQYAKNLAELLAALSSGAAAGNGSFHFLSGSAGGAAASPDQVWGLAMCYADSNAARCQDCLRKVASIDGVTELCPSTAHMTNVSLPIADACLLRYAEAPFLGSADTGEPLQHISFDVVDVADVPSMNTTRWRLLSELAERAAGHDQRLAYGSQEYTAASSNGSRTVVYGLAQCTLDLVPRECTRCFAHILGMVNMTDSPRGTFSVFSCYLRYQLNDRIDVMGVPAPAPQPALPSGSAPPPLGSEGSKPPLIAALAAAAGAVMLLVAGV